MTTAREVAIQLRKLADSLEAHPDLPMQKAWVSFYCHSKEHFINAVRILPRPLAKSDSGTGAYTRIKVEFTSGAMDIFASVEKSLTCELVEPAKPAVYRCDPILSLEEDAELNAEVSR